MCGRFVLSSPLEAVARTFDLDPPKSNFPPRYNIAPTQAIAVVRQADEDSGTGAPIGTRELIPMRWGLVPFWMKELPKSRPLINARLETAALKPSFRASWRHRRCLVPFDGWYEWMAARGGKGKQPYFIHPANPQQCPLAFAGLWERWYGPDGGSWLETVAILTMPAPSSLSHLHHRMPVVLNRSYHDRWLGDGVERTPKDIPPDALVSYADYKAYPVSDRVNRVSYDAADLVVPLTGHQPRLF
ncbi:DUF159 family protein [Iodidimonas gelatinilytica]|uniref:Abasic site processing protein n=1 Tax=Iodidimonas gelatinilytica TaxID=1236966 RepID=A0A5A7MX36_9PROT|nr:SOS response-associated peptidase [Iodidimonas gelatinilytica]GEQ97147.1 DUF159 family protein [Iodidimonas gelatinilytica]GEQ99479.1 DUF159 family protein [Iodidimonas gelatinilytica]